MPRDDGQAIAEALKHRAKRDRDKKRSRMLARNNKVRCPAKAFALLTAAAQHKRAVAAAAAAAGSAFSAPAAGAGRA